MKNKKFNRIKLAATLQALMSALFIVCIFLPCVKVDKNLGDDDFLGISLLGYVEGLIILLSLHIINIFIQAHGSCRLFSAISSIVSFIFLGMSYSNMKYKFPMRGEVDFDLMFPFYLTIALLVALLIVPTLIVKSGNSGMKVTDSDNIQESVFDTK